MLLSWANELNDTHVAWVSCRNEHNDPVVLAEAIRAALDPPRAVPRGRPLGRLMGTKDCEHATSRRVVLVLDDVHLLHSAQVLAGIEQLIGRRPHSVSLLFSGRDDPDLPWHRIRLRGVVELHGPDLAFEVAEARKLLAYTFGTVLPDKQVAELCRLTEGWAAGLCLAGLAMRDAPRGLGGNGARLGLHPFLRRFMESEVLDGLPDDQIRFLEATSVLDPLDPELCDLLTERHDSADLLEQFVEMNLFTSRVSLSPARFKYHALFSEFLRSRLDRSKYLDRASLLATASQWYEGEGMTDAAITAALDVGDFDRAETLIRAACGPRIRSGMVATVVRWVRALPPELIERSPELSLVLARASAAQGDLLIFETAIESARRHYQRNPEPWLRVALPYLDFYRRLLKGDLGGLVEPIETAIQILAAEPEQPEVAMLGVDEESLLAYGGVAHLLAGHLDRAIAMTGVALTPARLSHPTRATILGLGIRTLAMTWAGDEPAAAECLESGNEAVLNFGGSTGDPLPFHMARAWISDGEVDDPGLAAVQIIVGELRFPLYRLLLALTEARHALNGGRTSAASLALAEADDLIARVPDAAYLGVLADRLRVELDMGETSDVGEELNRREIEILTEIAAGASRREAARKLHLSVNTVKTYLRSAYRKLGATNRNDAVRRAHRLGFIVDSETTSTSPGPGAHERRM
jgi:LuxR family maltose regulon positive regulatory protein